MTTITLNQRLGKAQQEKNILEYVRKLVIKSLRPFSKHDTKGDWDTW